MSSMIQFSMSKPGLVCKFIKNNSIVRSFHSTNYELGGRKVGSKAHMFKPRDPSKKQIKKRRELIEDLKLKKDPSKEKMKEKQIQRMANSEEFKSTMQELRQSITPLIDTILSPPSNNQLGLGQTATTPKINEPSRPGASLSNHSDTQKPKISVIEQQIRLADESLQMISDKKSTQEIVELAPDANMTLTTRRLSVEKKFEIFLEIKKQVSIDSVSIFLKEAVDQRKFSVANKIFDEVLKTDLVPGIDMWTDVVQLYLEQGQVQKAESALTTLRSSNNPGLVHVYNLFLKRYADLNRPEEMKKYWMQLKRDGLVPTIESFDHIIKFSAKQGDLERAIFYYDELRSLGLIPTKKTMLNLIEASSKAPYWINGFQDSILDTLSKFESLEIMPDTEVYNAIIKGFADSRDPIAAEYFFWEMKRKNISPNEETYLSLIQSYSENQLVGAKKFGRPGRYVRPPEAPLTPDEEAITTLGASEVVKIATSGMFGEVKEVKGGKRIKVTLSDLMDEDPDYAEDVMSQIRYFANEKKMKNKSNQSIGNVNPEETGEFLDQVEFEGLDLEKEAEQDSTLREMLEEYQFKKGFEDQSIQLEANPLYNKLKNQETFEDPFMNLENIKGCISDEKLKDLNSDGPANIQKRLEALELLDDTTNIQKSSKVIQPSPTTLRQITNSQFWSMLEFGRPPEQDYSFPIEARRELNVKRAELAFQELRNIKKDNLSIQDWNGILSVYANGLFESKAKDIYSQILQNQILPNPKTCEIMTGLMIRKGKTLESLQFKTDLTQLKMRPTPSTYGMIIESFVHKEKILEALQVLEEASSLNAKIPETHMKVLRNRCTNLGITHPNIPADPLEWVQKVKEERRKPNKSSNRVLQQIRK